MTDCTGFTVVASDDGEAFALVDPNGKTFAVALPEDRPVDVRDFVETISAYKEGRL